MTQKPVLKWAGNKLPIVDRIKAVLPSGSRLVEPFVGSGAVFLNTDYPSYLLSDASKNLWMMYVNMIDDPRFFDYELDELFRPENNQAAEYYNLRKEYNERNLYDVRRSAIFVYLNRHCFNGLCRFNKNGGFNVPFGKYAKPYYPKEEISTFRKKFTMHSTTLGHGDFEDVVRSNWQPGDVIYCDPPYAPLTDTADFSNYTGNGFGPDDQQRLAELAEDMRDNGVPVVISNHDTPYTRNLYKNASKIESFDVQRFISAKASGRTKARELLACYYS